MQFFKDAIQENNIVPSRVRGDGGGENVRIASYIKRIGEDDKAFIEGSS
jgi:hypothetical protein